MKPTMEQIMKDINSLQETVRAYDAAEKQLSERESDEGKRILSDRLAYLTYEIRRKYKLTSQYFFVAECAAQNKYEKEYEKEENYDAARYY